MIQLFEQKRTNAAPPALETNRRRFLAGLAGAAVGGGLIQMLDAAAPAGEGKSEGATAGTPSAGQMMAGTAKVDIAPPDGEGIDILNKKMRGGEPLYARVLVLQQGGIRVAIVSLDLIVFASAKVIEQAREKWGVDHVLLCGTHTHASPVPQGMVIKPPLGDWTRLPKDPGTMIDWPGLSSDPWYAATEEKIVQAIGEATKHMFPARVAAGEGPFQSAYMAHNRRRVHPDGRVEMMWDNPKRIPTTPVDPTVGFIRVEDLSGKPRALVVHYACHPVGTMGAGFVSRDFPGATVDYIEEQLGPDCMAMFVQGASGDIDPYDMRLTGQYRLDMIRQAGISLGKGVLRVSESVPSPDASAPESLRVEKCLLNIPNRDGKASTDVGVAVVVINNQAALVGIPGEPFIQHQLDLRERSPMPNVFMTGLTYSGQGSPFVIYLPTVQAAKEGGYGAQECTFLDPGAGAKMVDAALASLKGLKKQ